MPSPVLPFSCYWLRVCPAGRGFSQNTADFAAAMAQAPRRIARFAVLTDNPVATRPALWMPQ